MKLYQYPNCSTCRKAIKFLRDNNVEFTSIDITVQPPTKKELRLMLKVYEGNVRKLFNTSGVAYRELNMKEKLPTMDDVSAIELLAGNGKLIKRPFLLSSDSAGVVGFNEEQWRSLL